MLSLLGSIKTVEMRIGCLQFAPQVGDVNNNLNRADSVLSKANPDDLDLLVLPELAFSGIVAYQPDRDFSLTIFKGTTSSRYKTSLPFSSTPAPASRPSGPGPSPSSTTALLLLAILKKSTFLRNGQRILNITTPPSLSTQRARQ